MLLNRIHARNEEIASQAQRHTADRTPPPAAAGSLSDWLSRHPALRRGDGPAAHRREVHYFDQLPGNGSDTAALEATWRDYLGASGGVARRGPAGAATFEKSPSYARFPDALALARHLVPGVHLVVVLRDPVDRAYFRPIATTCAEFKSSTRLQCHHARHGRFYEVSRPLPRSPAGAVVSAAPRRGCFRAAWTLDEAEGAHAGDCGAATYRRSRARPGPARRTFDAYVRGATVAKLFLRAPPAPAADDAAAGAGAAPGAPRWVAARWAKAPGGAVDVVADGDYAAQLSSIYGHFPRRQVHVLFFDDVVGDPLGVLDELQAAPNSTIQFDFNGRLGLPYHDFEPQLRRRKGRYDVAPLRTSLWDHALDALRPRRHRDAEAAPPMAKATRALLRDFYEAPLRRLWRTLRDHGDLHVIPPRSWSDRSDDDAPAPRFRARRSPRVPSPGAQLTDEVP
ncbi:[heparan sulfate]-glucosamine N-sulfotransferase [Aureococcus anophagefferens]|uniref:[heparan sulfate]-glucosamine N-sulfotransferase n=1 Tax=Aureococcus anophagefferens TaxID=44056 RepID=A0ABR1FR44_AURAN